jgi:hypothetical protein
LALQTAFGKCDAEYCALSETMFVVHRSVLVHFQLRAHAQLGYTNAAGIIPSRSHRTHSVVVVAVVVCMCDCVRLCAIVCDCVRVVWCDCVRVVCDGACVCDSACV